jgi:uncharacterized paraquat-inducible protein A
MLSGLHGSHSPAPPPCCGTMRGIDRGSGVVLTTIAYVDPMSQFWKAGTPMTSNITDGIQMLFGDGYWYGVMILLVSVIQPLTQVLALTWFLLSIRFGWSQHLRFKTGFYRFIDEVGR